MTASRKPNPREIIRELQEEWAIPLSETASHLLDRLELNGNPAGTRRDHAQLAAVLGPLYRPTVLISWNSQDTLGKQCRFGQRSSALVKRTPEQERSARRKTTQRAVQQLEALGILTVLPNAGPSHRADRRPNLYALDLEACESLIERHRSHPVELDEETYEGTPVSPRDYYEGTEESPRNYLRGDTEQTYEGTPVSPKDQLLIKDHFSLSQDHSNEEDHLGRPLEKSTSSDTTEREKIRTVFQEHLHVALTPEETENVIDDLLSAGITAEQAEQNLKAKRDKLRAALRATSTSRAIPAEEEELLNELQSLSATPEQVEAAGPILKAKGWKNVTPRQIVHDWPYVLDRLDSAGSLPAMTSTQGSGLCSCGGSIWLDGPSGLVHCWKYHDESGQPDHDRWLELDLVPA
jgi:hypothetical protein